MADPTHFSKNKSYIRKSKLGEGTYASVYEAEMYHTFEKTGKILKGVPRGDFVRKVAIKKIKVLKECDGLELNGLREIDALKRVRSPYVLGVVDVFMTHRNINIVLEHVATDLEKILRSDSVILMPTDIKMLIQMLAEGMRDIHSKYVVHRDLKPSNILVDSTGRVKIADFGLARDLTGEEMTVNVVTRWYRAPELFFGARLYSEKIDIWSMGLIFAEIILRVPLFAGDTDFQQMEKIFDVLGAPSQENWPEVSKLPNFLNYKSEQKVNFEDIFKGISKDLLEVLSRTIVLNPMERATASEILQLKYFKSGDSGTFLKNIK